MPGPDAAPITIRTANDEVYRRLRVWITSGELAPGARLSIRGLAALCGVSTTPVREALKQLQAEGLVVSARRSLTVTQLDPHQVHQVFEIRLRLEQLACEWAIDLVTEDDIQELREILDTMAGPSTGPAEWRELNQDFHRRFYDCTRSPHLLEQIQAVWDRVEPYLAIYASTVEDFDEAHRQHLSLLDHIERRNLPALLEELAEHLRYTEATIMAALGKGVPSTEP